MSRLLSAFIAKIGGQFAANHQSAPGASDMASVSTITPNAQLDHATMHWLNQCLERGKREVFTSRILMNPGVANALLAKNPGNRHVSQVKVEHYARDMAAGRWDDNGETIIVSSEGLLNDGQHRMMAVIDANTVVPFLFVFGVSRESRTTVDQGKARSAGDYLDMDGASYAHNAATAARWLIAYERADGRNLAQRPKITNAEVLERCRADTDITVSAAFAHKNLKAYRALFSHTVMAVAHYILSDINKVAAEEYLTQIALGENIKRGDPAFAVRQAFLSGKRERQDALEIVLHGWNAYRSKRKLMLAKSVGSLPAVF